VVGANDLDIDAVIRQNDELQREVAELKGELRRQRRFGLVFERDPGDEPEAADAALAERLPVLTELPSRRVAPSVEHPGPPHLLIEGDNLHALAAMQYTHAGAVDVIYIDPPYNTGSEFVYNDKLVDKADAWRHSKWLAFMDRRLRLAHKLLAACGVIFIAIDDHEGAHLRLLCDQIFGDDNFIGNIVWDGGPKNGDQFLSEATDYMLVYARDKEAARREGIRWRERPAATDLILTEAARIRRRYTTDDERTKALRSWFASLAKDHPAREMKHYNNIDDRGVWFGDAVHSPAGNGGTYDVLHPVTGRPCKVPSRGWLFAPETAKRLIEEDLLAFGPDETSLPKRKRYLHEHAGKLPHAVFHKDRRAAVQQLNQMIGRAKFDYPKDPSVLARWLRLAGPDDAVVLDFFAGSGSTAHAVAMLNASDGGTRQAILITNNENNICTDVTHPRLKAALTGDWADGKRDPLPGELQYYRCKFVTRSANRDTILTRLAMHSVDLVAIRERTFELAAGEKGRWALLTSQDKAVAVWADPDLCDLSPLTEVAAGVDATDKILYCFTSDDDQPAIDLDEWPGWRPEALPRHLLHAMRAAADT
jgi:hypothetical protein